MRLRDFLASIPSFSDFSDDQLISLEAKASIENFAAGDIVFTQGDSGERFYVIHDGAVDVLIQENLSLVRKGNYGKVVNRLTQGCYFGERALLTSEKRAATIRCLQETCCLTFSRAVYEEVISGSSTLVGQDTRDEVDWSTDHETRSLFRHVEKILEIFAKSASPNIRRVLYELSTAFTPELSIDEIISRMVLTVKSNIKADRVGLFVLSDDQKSMVLKVSERSKGIRLPMRGLAGAVAMSNNALNIPDAYKDPRFDATMDRRTGYRTRQVLGVPVRHPISGDCVGILQVNNRSDGSLEPFWDEQQEILELAASQLSELLHGRTDAFIHAGAKPGAGLGTSGSSSTSSSSGIPRGIGNSMGNMDGTSVVSSAEPGVGEEQFSVELSSLALSAPLVEMAVREALVALDVTVQPFLALNPLCRPQTVSLVVPGGKRGLASSLDAWQQQQRASTGSDSHNNRHSSSGSNSSSSAAVITLAVSERVTMDIALRDLPRAARLLFRVSGRKTLSAPSSSASPSASPSSSIALGWAAATIFDFKGSCSSQFELRLFPGDNAVPINTTLSNVRDAAAATLSGCVAPDHFLDVRGKPKVGSTRIVHAMPPAEAILSTDALRKSLTPAHEQELARLHLLSFNPLCLSILTEANKDFVWEVRHSIFQRSELLPLFIMSVNWASAECVSELYTLLELWALPAPVNALQLLDRRFMDPKVRAVAVHCLENIGDEDLALYMMQLCQQLKFENYTDSALARFLVRRALQNQRLIGHIFFWFLHSELHNMDVKRRFTVLLQVYIRNCGSHRVELGHQLFVMKRLERVAEQVIQRGESKAQRLEILKEQLKVTVLPPVFQLPLNPLIKVCGIDVNKCRVMESKKKPLWLTMKNADEDSSNPNIVLMLKVGDDLRQDALILQLLRVMQELWRREGLDMQMQVYDCISTGHERGLLQVVMNASTLGSILMHSTDQQSGGNGLKAGSLSRKIRAAMKAMGDYEVLKSWLKEQVATEVKGSDAKREAEMERRVQHFMISTAAYCVASYVLGIGDRHNDNLMITKAGHFFHIDFGHILGNFKSKYGVKRERAPFVFTPAMKQVMRPDQYAAFVDLCCDIYNVLREHAALLVSLCSLAIPCNLPELQEEKDVMWLYEKLLVGASDEEAADHFKQQLEISLNTRGTRMNDAVHMLAHA